MMKALYGKAIRVREWFRTVAASSKRNPVKALSRSMLKDVGLWDPNDEYLPRSKRSKPYEWDE